MANWKITTGYAVTNEALIGAPTYASGVFIISSATNEQTPPTNVRYVAKWGNNTSGNGSRDRPYLTISRAITDFSGSPAQSLIVVGSGVYRESCSITTQNACMFVADGDVTIEGTGINNFLSTAQGGYTFIGFKITNFLNIGGGGAQYCVALQNCVVSNILGVVENRSLKSNNNIYYNINRFFDNTANGMTTQAFSRYLQKNTFVNIKNVEFLLPANVPFGSIYNIFKNCNIQYRAATGADYNLYHNCNFRFNATAGTQPSLLPEDTVNGFPNSYVPTGWIGTSGVAVTGRPSTPAEIQAGQVAAGFAGIGFAKSLVTDPLFNNVALGDFTLQPTSPARNLAYEGTFIGAKSVGTPLKFRTVEANGDWDNTTALGTNITVVDNSATLTTDAVGTIVSNVINLGKDKVLRAISMQGLLGDRNGEWVDTSTDLDSGITASGSLVPNQSYIVETGTLTYNGPTYTIGQKFAAVSGATTYSGAGEARRIIEAPNRVCYEMRFSSISAVDCEAQPYYKFEFDTQPTVNRTSDISTNPIQYGNGEVLFRRGTNQVFIISGQWIQIRLNVQNNNLV